MLISKENLQHFIERAGTEVYKQANQILKNDKIVIEKFQLGWECQYIYVYAKVVDGYRKLNVNFTIDVEEQNIEIYHCQCNYYSAKICAHTLACILLFCKDERYEKQALQAINEKQKEIINAINMLEDRYKNTIYLTQIEKLTYKETAQILGESVQNVRNLIHRGKKELRKILIKKGFDEMNKVSKVIIAILCISILLAGGVYATAKIVESFSGKAKMAPTFTSKISSIDTNKVWCGTFNLVWNDFMNDVIGEKIEFEDGPSELADELNKQTFTVNELNSNSYFKIHGTASFDLKDKIENGIKEKFNENSKILDKVQWGNPEVYVLYAMLKKEFNYLEKFPTLKDNIFGDSEEKVKYFGIEPDTSQNASKNIEILFYNSEEDFAIKLKTKEGEEVYLYRTTGENKSFEENYKEMLEKQAKYTGDKNWNKNDVLNIPFIKINNEINYDELCGRWIKGTNWYIRQAIQTIDFELNNYGGSVKSEALIEALIEAVFETGRKFIYNDDFILYLKEEYKEKPYFALKVDNTDVLVAGENN